MTQHTGPMSQRVRDVGQGVIVAFPEEGANIQTQTQEDIGVYRAFFFRVAKYQRFSYEYTQLGSLGAGGTLAYDYLGDTGHGSGEDIFRIENDDFKAYHVGVGVGHPGLEVYHKLDPSSPERELDHNNQSEPTPGGDPDWGWYDGRETGMSIYDPPSFTERLALRNATDGQFLQWGFRARSALSSGQTDLQFTGRTYQFQPVTDKSTQDTMLDAVVRDPDEPEIPTIFLPYGDVFTFKMGSALPDDWDNLRKQGLARKLNFQSTGE